MEQKKVIYTERTHWFMPSAAILMKVDIYYGKAECSAGVTVGDIPEKNPTALQQDIQQAIHTASCANEILMSRLVTGENGEVYYERQKQPHYCCTVLPAGTDWRVLRKEQERIPFDLKNGELIRYFLIPAERHVELIFLAHHLAGDGKSMLILLQDIQRALNGEGLDEKELLIMQQGNFPKKSRLPFGQRRYLAKLNRQWQKEKKIFKENDYQKLFAAYWSGQEHEIEAQIFSKEETQEIQKRCREYGVTVNSYLTAAVLKAQGKDWAEVGFSVDVRGKEQSGMGNFVSGQAFETPYIHEHGLKENAWQIHSRYQKELQNVRKKYFSLQFIGRVESNLLDAACMQVHTDYESDTAKKLAFRLGYYGENGAVQISNLTKIRFSEKQDGYQMKNLLFVPPLAPYAKQLFGVVTLGDNLALTLHYDKNTIAGEELFKRLIDVIKEDIHGKSSGNGR